MALFGQMGTDGKLHLVNHLGIRLDGDPEQILSAVQNGQFPENAIDWNAGRGHDAGYAQHVRDVDAETPRASMRTRTAGMKPQGVQASW